MKRSMQRLLSLAVCATLLLGVLTGCGAVPAATGSASSDNGTAAATASTAASESTSAEPSAAAEPAVISAMVFDRGNCPEGEGSVTDNRWTKWINEQMAAQNITVNFIPVPRSEESTKIPLMMASSTAADVMMMYNASIVAGFYQNGGTYNLDPYLGVAPQLVSYLGEACLDLGRNEAGELFAVPARRSTTSQANVFIRKDWLDKVGLSVPKTVDELYQALSAFKEKDPGGVGKDRIVCFSGGWILPHAFYQNVGDKVTFLTGFAEYADAGYIDYLRFRNKLYNEGLMDPEYFAAQDGGQKDKELFVSGSLGYWESNVNANVDSMRGGLLQNLKKNVPDAEFVSMEPIANVKDGKVYNLSYPTNGAFLFVPKTAKNPEAVMKYLDFLAGEGGFTLFHGFENEHHVIKDGVPVVKDAEYNAKTKDWTRHDLFLVGNQGYYKSEEEFIKTTSVELPGWENYVTDNYTNATAGVRLPNIEYTSPTQIEQTTNINKVNSDYLTKATTCKPEEVDAVYAEWRTELEKYDVVKILEERRAYFEKAEK